MDHKMGHTKRGRGRPPKHAPVAMVTERIQQMFSCPVCDKAFSSHETMTAHKKCHNLMPFVKIDR